jgi:hypothetical protein
VSFHNGLTWCSNPDCVCGRQGPVCPEWMGYDDTEGYDESDVESWPARWCPRCGWERDDHMTRRESKRQAIEARQVARAVRGIEWAPPLLRNGKVPR